MKMQYTTIEKVLKFMNDKKMIRKKNHHMIPLITLNDVQIITAAVQEFTEDFVADVDFIEKVFSLYYLFKPNSSVTQPKKVIYFSWQKDCEKGQIREICNIFKSLLSEEKLKQFNEFEEVLTAS